MFAELKKMFSPRTKYTYEGQVFDLPTKFQKGVDDKVKATVKAITPLPAPLSQKKLVFAMPRQSAFIKESAKRFAAVHGGAVGCPVGYCAGVAGGPERSGL